MARKLGGLNIKEWLQPRKQRPPRSHRVELCGKPTHYLLGKADDKGEVTSKSTPYPTVAEVQTSKQCLAEIPSGRPHSQQELAITCKDPPNEAKAGRSVVGGHIRYYGVPTNGAALFTFRFQVGRLWHRALLRRSQNAHVLWSRMRRLIDRWLPPARICHPYPLRRMGVIT
jgi:hypothetical protein